MHKNSKTYEISMLNHGKLMRRKIGLQENHNS